MTEASPIRTASWAAEMRAAHQIYDDPVIFADPLALKIVGAEMEAHIRQSSKRYLNLVNRKVRRMFAARSRFCEDAMGAAIGRGVEQVVLLGAGLDTLAYRSPLAGRARIFEVDHPATQAWKRQRLEEAGIVAPPSVVFAPLDFEKVPLAEGLVRAGVDVARSAFFSWLGVLVYLPSEIALSTARFVGSLLPDSEIVFDYLVPPHTLDLSGQHTFSFLQRAAADLGERWQTFFEPGELAAEMDKCGLRVVTDVDAETFAAGFETRPQGSARLAFTRLVQARAARKSDPVGSPR